MKKAIQILKEGLLVGLTLAAAVYIIGGLIIAVSEQF